MRFALAFAALLLTAGVALAQASPSADVVVFAYRQLGVALNDLMQAQRSEIEAMKKKATDMDQYLRACGDKPGCTVPTGGGK